MAKWRYMATEIWVNIGSGNGMLPDGTKPANILQSEFANHTFEITATSLRNQQVKSH